MADVTLTAIHIHPIKSCRRLEVESATVLATGLANDRSWQVVNDQGHPVTQRQHKALATVQPKIISGGLQLQAPGQPDIEISQPDAVDPNVVAKCLFGLSVPAGDAGDAAAAWFTELLDEPVRLTAVIDDQSGWTVPPAFELHDQPMAFVDAAPVLVASNSSLGWLQERAEEPFGMDRFRPNLIVDGSEPFVEDTWQAFSIGAAECTLGMPWPRCAIPQIDQDTADRHREPAKVLKAHRWCSAAPDVTDSLRPVLEGNALFGIGCTVGPVGTVLRIGDLVSVSATGAPLIDPPA